MHKEIFKKQTPENMKIEYWVTLWEELIENYNMNSYGLELINPQLLLLNIIDDIESNQSIKKNLKQYYLKMLGFFIKNDPGIYKKFKSNFNLILKALNEDRVFYLKTICQKTLKIFKSSDYFRELFFSLKSILTNGIWEDDNENNIKFLSQHLITELLINGYKLKAIEKFPRNLFSGYRLMGKYLYSEFPAKTNINDFLDNDKIDIKKYNQSLKEEIENLTITDRLDYFIKYFSKHTKTYYIICQLNGIKANEIDFKIGNIRFYSPTQKTITQYSEEKLEYKRITGKDVFDEVNPELFKSKPDDKLLNIVVKIDAINIDSASLHATRLMERALDLLRCFYDSKYPFELSSHQIVLDSKKQEISFTLGLKHFNLKNQTWFLELYDNPKSYMQKIIQSVGLFIQKPLIELKEIEKKIINSLHWFRKASETDSIEDKLLNYWIIIENIISVSLKLHESLNKDSKKYKLSLIQEIIPCLNILDYTKSFSNELYDFLIFMNMYNPSIPKELVKKCYLTPKAGTLINLTKFLRYFPELKKYTNLKILKDKIEFAENLYYNPLKASYIISQKNKSIKEDLMMIYRFRNKISHNAHYQDTLLQFYVSKAEMYSKQLLQTVIDGYCHKNLESLDEILMTKYVEYDQLIKNIEVDKIKLIDLI